MITHLKPLRYALAALLLAPAAFAQDADVATTPAMWVIEANDSRVYLLGSVHLLPPDVYPMPNHIDAAYLDADAVAFEIDMRDMSQMASAMMQRGMLTDGRTLTDLAGAEVVDRATALLTPLGVPREGVDRMKPWMVALIAGSAVAQQIGMEVEAGLDMHYLTRAVADEKGILALETVESQIDIFASLDMDTQVSYLRQTLDQIDEAADRLRGMVAAWRVGDEQLLANLLHEGMDSNPALREALLDTRNRAWIPGIEAMLATPGTTTLVVVGAGHLVGPVSVIELLEEAGYEVVRL